MNNLDLTQFTIVQQQVIKSIGKSIEKDLSQNIKNKERTDKKIASLEAEIDELRGVFKANEELLQRNIDNGLEALKAYTDDGSWVIVDGKLSLKKVKPFLKDKGDALNESSPAAIKEPHEEKENKEESVDRLPWEEGDLPFGNVFSKQ